MKQEKKGIKRIQWIKNQTKYRKQKSIKPKVGSLRRSIILINISWEGKKDTN